MLLAAVVGSGIMADQLSGENQAIALLANTIATGSAFAALILMLSRHVRRGSALILSECVAMVHRVNLICQPGGDGGSRADRYARRHPTD